MSWLSFLLDLIAKIFGVVFTETLNTPGEVYDVQDQAGTVEIPIPSVDAILDQYSNI